MSTTTKRIAVVSTTPLDQTNLEQITENINIEIVFHVDSVRALFAMVASVTDTIDLILIDIDRLYETDKDNIINVIHTLAMLLRCNMGIKKIEIPAKLEVAIAIVARLPIDIEFAREVLSSGDVRGIYPGGDDFTVLEKRLALEEFFSGQCHVPIRIQSMLHPKRSTKSEGDAQALTRRQQQILTLITTRGASNKAIAKILGITDSTVKLHVTSILKKCGVRSRTQLVAFARNHAA